MNFSLLLLTVLFGLTTCDQAFKQVLTDNLNYCEGQLKEGIASAKAHGFDYYLRDYEHISREVDSVRADIQAFEGERKSDAGTKIYNTVNNLCDRIISSVNDPFPGETIKYRALHLAVIKQINAGQAEILKESHVVQVFKIVDQEGYIADHATEDMSHERATLKTMYEALDASLQKEWIPLFNDHYRLSTRTKKIIQENIKYNKTAEASGFQNFLNTFDDLTVQLAKLYPINQKEKVEKFIGVLIQHYKLRLQLQDLKHLDPTVKDQLLQRLDSVDKSLSDGIQEYKKIGGNEALEKILQSTKDRIGQVREDAKKLDEEVELEGAAAVSVQVDDLALIIPLRLAFIYKSDLATALNFAARQPAEKGQPIYDIVQEIIFYEYSMHCVSAFDETTMSIAKTNLAAKKDNIKKQSTAIYLSEFDDLIYGGRKLISAAKGSPPAWKPAYDEFQKKILEFNGFVSLDTGTKVLKYFETVKTLNQMFDKLFPLAK